MSARRRSSASPRRRSLNSTSMASFKESYTEDERSQGALDALSMGKIPIICERAEGCALPDLEKKKFVVAPLMTVGTFTKLLRERVASEIGGSFYLFIGDSVLNASGISMDALYRANKDADGLLYVTYNSVVGERVEKMGAYKSTHPYSERREEAVEALGMEKIPIICERAETSLLPDLEKKKFVVAPDMTVGTFSVLLKERVATEVSSNFYLLLNGSVLNASGISMKALYAANKDVDGLLYVTYDSVVAEDAVRLGAYKSTHPYAERKEEAAEGSAMGKIPIICERQEGSDLDDLVKKKFIVSPDMTVGTFTVLLRERVMQELEKPIYLFVGDRVLTASSISMADLHKAFKDVDGFLYVNYAGVVSSTAPQIGFFKGSYTKQERLTEAEKALWLEKIPIICEKAESSSIPSMTQRKFFVSRDMTVPTFAVLLRERVMSELKRPIYLFTEGRSIPLTDRPIRELYEKYKDEDKFMYVTYSGDEHISR